MGLKLKADPTFRFAVKIPLPGGKESEAITFEFKHRTQAELKEFYAAINDVDKPLGDVDALLQMIVSWDLKDAYDRENVERLVENYHGAAEAITSAYLAELTQRRLGNSGPLRPR